MKKTKIIIALVIILSITLLGVCTYAGQKGRGMEFGGFKRHENTEFSKRPKLSEEELTAKKDEMKENLKAKLDNGEITEEQYNKMLEKIEEGKGIPMGKGFGRMGHPEMKKDGEKEFKKPEHPELTEEEIEKMKERKESFKKFDPSEMTEEELAELKEKFKNAPKGKGPMGKGFHREGRPEFKGEKE